MGGLCRQLGAGNNLESDAAIEGVGNIVFARPDQVFARARAIGDDASGQIGGFGFEMRSYKFGALERKPFIERLGPGAAGMTDDFQTVTALRRAPGDFFHPLGIVVVSWLGRGEAGAARLEQEIDREAFFCQAILDDIAEGRSSGRATAEFEIGEIDAVAGTELVAGPTIGGFGKALEGLFVVAAFVESRGFTEQGLSRQAVAIGRLNAVAWLALFTGLDIAGGERLLHPRRTFLKV